jgi:hypothetical protein
MGNLHIFLLCHALLGHLMYCWGLDTSTNILLGAGYIYLYIAGAWLHLLIYCWGLATFTSAVAGESCNRGALQYPEGENIFHLCCSRKFYLYSVSCELQEMQRREGMTRNAWNATKGRDDKKCMKCNKGKGWQEMHEMQQREGMTRNAWNATKGRDDKKCNKGKSILEDWWVAC